MPIDQLLSSLDPQYQEFIKDTAQYLIIGATPFLMYWGSKIIGSMGGGAYYKKEKDVSTLTKSKMPQYDTWIHAKQNPEVKRGATNQYNIF